MSLRFPRPFWMACGASVSVYLAFFFVRRHFDSIFRRKERLERKEKEEKFKRCWNDDMNQYGDIDFLEEDVNVLNEDVDKYVKKEMSYDVEGSKKMYGWNVVDECELYEDFIQEGGLMSKQMKKKKEGYAVGNKLNTVIKENPINYFNIFNQPNIVKDQVKKNGLMIESVDWKIKLVCNEMDNEIEIELKSEGDSKIKLKFSLSSTPTISLINLIESFKKSNPILNIAQAQPPTKETENLNISNPPLLDKNNNQDIPLSMKYEESEEFYSFSSDEEPSSTLSDDGVVESE